MLPRSCPRKHRSDRAPRKIAQPEGHLYSSSLRRRLEVFIGKQAYLLTIHAHSPELERDKSLAIRLQQLLAAAGLCGDVLTQELARSVRNKRGGISLHRNSARSEML